MEEVKSSSKIILRSKDHSLSSVSSDPYMLVASVGCLISVYFKSQYMLFGFLLLILSCFLTSKKKTFNIQSLMPMLGIFPSLIKLTYDVIKALVTGKPL